MGRDLAGDIYFESRLSDWLVQYFKTLGADHERIEVAEGRANVIARFDPSHASRTLLLDAHQDTVPVDGMTIDPFHAKIRDGRMYGRGSCDVKGGMAAMLHAFGRLFTEGTNSKTSIVLSCSCDEEATTIGVQDLVRYWQPGTQRSRLLTSRPDGAVIAEPTELQAVVAHRGVVRFRVHTHGVAVHSSEPDRGKNAIYDMASVLSEIQAVATSLPQSRPPHPLCGPATISVGRIEGGTSVNIVPAHCQIEIDRRIIPGEDPREVFESLASRLQAAGKDVTCDDPWVSSPALPDENNAWIADAILAKVSEVTEPKNRIGVAYCTHASPISDAGVPSIVFGPGSIAQAHTKDEYIDIDSLDTAAEVYFRVCSDESSWEG